MQKRDTAEVTSGRRRMLIIVVIALALLGGGLVAKYEWDELMYCSSPPSQQEQASKRTFVLAHISDARDFAWEIADCDDDGVAVLSYTTALDLTTALAAFRADAACAPPTKQNAYPDTLLCRSGEVRVEVGFEEIRDKRTSGYLAWQDRDIDL